MGKRILVHQLPDRKNSFRVWVDKIRSDQREPFTKSLYIRKSGKNLDKNLRNWNNVQFNSRNRYLDKIHLMEEIRQRKIEIEAVSLIYTPRYACPAVSGSK